MKNVQVGMACKVTLKEEVRVELRKLQYHWLHECFLTKDIEEVRKAIKAIYENKDNFETVLEINVE